MAIKKDGVYYQQRINWLPLIKQGWELIRVKKWEFASHFHSQMRIRVDESWQERVCMRVFSTLISWWNENKSCMRVDESWEARVCVSLLNSHVRVKREKELHESWWELRSDSFYESLLNSFKCCGQRVDWGWNLMTFNLHRQMWVRVTTVINWIAIPIW